ncbi:hypothetical protein GCM10011575_38910 [Microlunatus endophyticus]|uniref:Uncharacterized protein n=1 Tax=Microlunatus endophyticus TaxID=1716077 RepID=A0A917SG85_9ACTN|nr:hypothetical protein [Microlunatus endophyticus]GGL76927.1 hypothetical protein GCM10011575_38910 [Microlunatus endophyticus]
MTDIEIRELVIPPSQGGPGWDELVARTQLYNTLVREVVDSRIYSRHRGHNLGPKIKINNLRLLNAVDHGASRVTTGNADENAAMLAINRALGFRPFLVHGLWQKALWPDPPAFRSGPGGSGAR